MIGLIRRLFAGAERRPAKREAQPLFAPPAFGEIFATSTRSAGLSFESVCTVELEVFEHWRQGDVRGMDRALRKVCPAECWPWPGYHEAAQLSGERPTRLRMVRALAGLIERRMAIRDRREQLVAGAGRMPWWQLRTVGDGLDPPECQAMDRQAFRFDSPVWLTRGPFACERVGCRCSVRPYRTRPEANRA